MPSGYVSSHPLEELLADISWFRSRGDDAPSPMTDELAEQWATHLLALFPMLNAGEGSRLALVSDWEKVCEAMQRIRGGGSGPGS